MDKSQAIKHLGQLGYSERSIMSVLDVSRTAVRCHLGRKVSKETKAPTGSAPTGVEDAKETKAPTGSSADVRSDRPSRSASACEPFREVVVAKLEQGLTAQRIFQDLVDEHGFTSRYPSVRRYVATLKESTPLPYRRLECDPGAEMQVDFGSGARCMREPGKWTKTYVFRAVLSHSRKGYSEAVRRMTVESFMDVLENCFWRVGGVPQVVIFDNGSCAVKAADWYDGELHPKIVDFCKHYNFALVPTRPRTPRHKGKIERGIGYVKSNALKGKTFDSLTAQNECLAHWEKTVADRRVHGTTKQQVGYVYDTLERRALQPLPRERFPHYEEGKRIVSRDGHVAVRHAYYSAPPEYVGREVWVRWNSHTLRILNLRMEQLAIHCTQEKGRFSTLGEHIAPEKVHPIEKGVEYTLRKVRFLGLHATRWAELLIEERGVQATRSLQGLLSLSKKYSSDELNRACDIAWKSKATNYRSIKKLLENRSAGVQQTMEFMEEHPIIRPVSEYGQFIRQAIQGG
ncbi:MAG: IS21 family transposase [Planctomycetota bacterium]|nr:IS21 family transposase [Planctomycetota bacterium]